MRASSSFSGILCLIAGLAIFSVQDLILKLISGDYPLHQAMMVRSLVALPFLIMIVRIFDGRLSTIATRGWWKMSLRGLLNFASYTFYYLALASLPLATTIALFFTAPLFITIASAVLLREKIPPVAALAVAAGFGGVLMIVRPGGGGLGWAGILPVAGALTYALSMIAARPLGRTESAAAMAFWSNICFLLCALALALWYGDGSRASGGDATLAFLTRGWVTPPWQDLALMAACGVIAAAALTLLTQAYRIAPSSLVAPFEYSAIFWGLLWGFLFWRDLPDAMAWGGIAVIVAAGMVVIRQGTRPARPAPATVPRNQPQPCPDCP